MTSAESFSFSGSSAKVQKFLGRLPSTPRGPDGRCLLGAYGGPRDSAVKPYRDLVYGTGLVLSDAVSTVQEALSQGTYSPSNGAVWIHEPPTDEPPRLAIATPPGPSQPDPSPPPPLLAAPLTAQRGLPSCPHDEEDSEFTRKRKRGWAKLISKTWKDDPGVCRRCGHRRKIITAIGPDQLDAIERVLRHLHRWAPLGNATAAPADLPLAPGRELREEPKAPRRVPRTRSIPPTRTNSTRSIRSRPTTPEPPRYPEHRTLTGS